MVRIEPYMKIGLGMAVGLFPEYSVKVYEIVETFFIEKVKDRRHSLDIRVKNFVKLNPYLEPAGYVCVL